MNTATQYPYPYQYQYQYQYPPVQQSGYPYQQPPPYQQGYYPYSQGIYPQQTQQGTYPYPQQSQSQSGNNSPPPSYTPYSTEISGIQGEKKIKKDQETEIREALEVANRALQHLYAAKKYLNKAYKWGVVDILGGDLISTMIKQGKMTDARRELRMAKEELTKLCNELKDVENINTLQTSNFLNISDFLFDGVLFDVLVQSKISEAKTSCKLTIVKVESIKKELEDKLNKYTSSSIKN